jgi:hypothetical protein
MSNSMKRNSRRREILVARENFEEPARVAQQEYMLAGCSKRPFSKAAASEVG